MNVEGVFIKKKKLNKTKNPTRPGKEWRVNIHFTGQEGKWTLISLTTLFIHIYISMLVT